MDTLDMYVKLRPFLRVMCHNDLRKNQKPNSRFLRIKRYACYIKWMPNVAEDPTIFCKSIPTYDQFCAAYHLTGKEE